MAIRQITVCDQCQESFDPMSQGFSIRRLNYENTQLNWRTIEGEFCCPACGLAFLAARLQQQAEPLARTYISTLPLGTATFTDTTSAAD